jgi:hypothetical protein
MVRTPQVVYPGHGRPILATAMVGGCTILGMLLGALVGWESGSLADMLGVDGLVAGTAAAILLSALGAAASASVGERLAASLAKRPGAHRRRFRPDEDGAFASLDRQPSRSGRH